MTRALAGLALLLLGYLLGRLHARRERLLCAVHRARVEQMDYEASWAKRMPKAPYTTDLRRMAVRQRVARQFRVSPRRLEAAVKEYVS